MDAALSVMNFAIYHKELTDMDEREAERERETEKRRIAEVNGDGNQGDTPQDPEDT